MCVTTAGFSTDLIMGIVLVAIILFSLSVHEFAHAWVANLFGDPTAKLEGRLSLNPIRHWDPIGTSLLVGLIMLTSFGIPLPIFGWGKPVPVDERNFDNPRIQGVQTALAGTMANLLLAVLIAGLLRLTHLPSAVVSALTLAVYINIFLMFFNLLPVPPLDGSRLLRLFLPDSVYYAISGNIITFFLLIFLVIYFLLDYVVLLSTHLTTFLIG
ncbi:MAG TPA: site-2 protease family protein [Candidatus Saccharimonadales bacterium]|nr:site-2 protease family protein [Candidatus Saccharimonadales bacterium]